MEKLLVISILSLLNSQFKEEILCMSENWEQLTINNDLDTDMLF